MTEYERSRTVQAPARVLFEVAQDPGKLDRWVPSIQRATQRDEGTLEVQGRDGPAEALWDVSLQQRRIEWGHRGDPDYAGWLQVTGWNDDEAQSEAILHLTFLGDRPETHQGPRSREVEDAMEHALDDLAALATAAG
jgi:hypothetical protein